VSAIGPTDSERAVTALAPLLASLARLLVAGSLPGDNLLDTLLLSVDLDDATTEEFARRELGRWARLLQSVQADPSRERRLAVAEALRVRGLPEASVILAMGIVTASAAVSLPAPRASTPLSSLPANAAIAIDPPELTFGTLAANQPASGELLITGGPGRIAAATDRIQLDTTTLGEGATRVRVSIAPFPGGIIWSWLTATTTQGTQRIPVVARWAAPGTTPSPELANAPRPRSLPPADPIPTSSPVESTPKPVSRPEPRPESPVVVRPASQPENLPVIPPRPASQPVVASSQLTPGAAGEQILTGHSDTVWALSWSPDGTLLASGSSDLTLRLWRADGAALGAFGGHTAPVTAVTWAPGGETLASASVDKTIRLWTRHQLLTTASPGRLAQSTTNALAHLPAPVAALAWSPDGAILAAANGTQVQLNDFRGQRQRTLVEHSGQLAALTWSPDSRFLISAGEDSSIGLWAADGTLQYRSTWNHGRILALAWSPDGQAVAIASGNGSICLWGADGNTRILAVDRSNPSRALAWSPHDGSLVVGHYNGVITLYGRNGQPLRTLSGHRGMISALAWSPTAPVLASSSANNEVRLWHTNR
jgi:hypothetical protein